MHGLPNVDYVEQIKTLVQNTIIEFAPKEVQELYAGGNTRKYLNENYVEVRTGNAKGTNIGFWRVYGLTNELNIQMDERTEAILQEGTLRHTIYTRLRDSKLVEKLQEQEELRDSVQSRLKTNLAVAKTVKQLYEILEPELHGYIPVVVEGENTLPACVAPVVDDLRKLGAALPEIPKATSEVTQ